MSCCSSPKPSDYRDWISSSESQQHKNRIFNLFKFLEQFTRDKNKIPRLFAGILNEKKKERKGKTSKPVLERQWAPWDPRHESLSVCSHIFMTLFTKEELNIFQAMHFVKKLPTKQVFLWGRPPGLPTAKLTQATVWSLTSVMKWLCWPVHVNLSNISPA
jgi:hypothetical protein